MNIPFTDDMARRLVTMAADVYGEELVTETLGLTAPPLPDGQTRRLHLVVEVINDGTGSRALAAQVLAGRRPDARLVQWLHVSARVDVSPHPRHEATP